MPKFSQSSLKKLSTCHPDLVRLFNEVIKYYDCTIMDGYRGKQRQNKLCEVGSSTKPWPNSKHNSKPSMAVDVTPYPIRWKDKERYYCFAGFVLGMAATMKIDLRWGGDWDRDRDYRDQQLYDLVHFELISTTLPQDVP